MNTLFQKVLSVVNPSYTDRAITAMQTIEGASAARRLLIEQKRQCGGHSHRPAAIQAQIDAYVEAEKRLKVAADIKQKPALIEQDRKTCAAQMQAAEKVVVAARRTAENASKHSGQQRERLTVTESELAAEKSAFVSRLDAARGQLAAAAASGDDAAESEAANTCKFLQRQAADLDTGPVTLRLAARAEAASKADAAKRLADAALAEAERALASAVVDVEAVELDAAVNLLLEKFISLQRAVDACPHSPFVGMGAPAVFVCNPGRVVGADVMVGAGLMSEAITGQLCDLPWPMGPEVFVDPLSIPDDGFGTVAYARQGLSEFGTRLNGHPVHTRFAQKKD